MICYAMFADEAGKAHFRPEAVYHPTEGRLYCEFSTGTRWQELQVRVMLSLKARVF